MSFLHGNAPANIRQKLEGGDTGLLRQDAINSALEEDQRELTLQETWNTWRVKETEILANESKTTFLATLRSSG
jgi:hypothetical protein